MNCSTLNNSSYKIVYNQTVLVMFVMVCVYASAAAYWENMFFWLQPSIIIEKVGMYHRRYLCFVHQKQEYNMEKYDE